MRVKCKKLISPSPEKRELESSPFLTKGNEYIVLSVAVEASGVAYYLQDNETMPTGGYFSAEQFEIISNYIPDSWVVNTDGTIDYFDLLPKTWLEHYCFWEKLHDDDPVAAAVYTKEVINIYNQEP